MIIHYLKVALRNLWKYRTHSLISVLCLAVGITFYTVMSLFVSRFTGYRDLPHVERRVMLLDSRTFLTPDKVDYLQSLHIDEIETLIAGSFVQTQTEVFCIDQHQRSLPYMVRHRLVNENYFSGYNLKVVAGDVRMQKEDEVVIHEKFAQRAFGNENPIGLTISIQLGKLGNFENYRIVGVVSGMQYSEEIPTDIYYPLTFQPREALQMEAIIKKGISIQTFKERMNQVFLEPGNEDSHMRIYSLEEAHSQSVRIELGGLLIGSLILITGIVNFLKFIIQMFYNRQRELAIRQCVGSGLSGLFILLFAECFCMMSGALLISLCISELIYHTFTSSAGYMVQELTSWFDLTDVYKIQCKVYLAVLAVCLLACLYPVWRIRRTSIVRMVMVGTRRHVFRNVMIGLQMAISLFFVGGTCVVAFVMKETIGSRVSYLSDKEEEHTLAMKVNSIQMNLNLDAILSDVQQMPEVESYTKNARHNELKYMNDDRSWYIRTETGMPNYFQFFQIPMEGKEVEADATNMIYVSKVLYKQLQKDSVQGMVRLGDVEYQIAGVFEHLHGEQAGRKQGYYLGTAFLPRKTMSGSTVYFRISPQADIDATTKKLTSIIRKYVPETLPLDLHSLSADEDPYEGTVQKFYYGILIVALISLIVVALSVYSAISMDTMSRQKEVAIRKINGATPKVIAWIFGRIYILTYLLVFAIVFPLGKQIAIIAFQEFDAPYRWDWAIGIFLGMALLIFLVTAFKIWQIMHVNPATIIKKE